MLPRHTIIRALAVVLTLGLIFATGGHTDNPSIWVNTVYALAFAHYLMALKYSGRQIQHAISAPFFFWKLGGMLTIAGGFLWMRWLPLVYYFGLHHAFNEAYQLDFLTKAKDHASIRALRTASVALYLIVYLFLLRHRAELEGIPFAVLGSALIVAYLAFFYYFWKASGLMSLSERIDNSSAEIVSLAAIFLSFFFTVQFLYIVAYHFIYWAFRPIPRMMSQSNRVLWNYVGMTAIMFAVTFAVSPMGLSPYPAANSIFYKQFIFWSYLHITLSFAVSDYHPRWMVRFFRPPPAKSAPLL